MDTFENYDGLQWQPEFDRSKIDNRSNISSPVCCEHPNIIFSPRWHEYFFKYGRLCLDGVLINLKSCAHFSKSALEKYILNTYQVTIENFNRFCIYKDDDTFLPLFYAVPCGSCRLCLDNKSNEYAFRATCETYTHPDDPLFITITYKPKYRPKNGVEVTHLQKFFKRLRFHLFELGLPTNFRYLACAEYGKKGGLPHYHVQLWNYPVSSFKTISQAYSPIYKSWLSYVKDDFGRRQYVTRSFYKTIDGRRRKITSKYPVMESKGMIKILPVTYGCTGYITKYFRKEAHNKLHYPNKTFLISSRKNGGIGSEFIRSKFDFVYANRNQDNIEITVPDVHLQKNTSRSVTGYIKNILFKSRSTILPKKMYNQVKSVCDSWHCLQAIMYAFNKDHLVSDLFNFRNIVDRLKHYLFIYPRYYYQVHFSWFFKFSKSVLKQSFITYFNKLCQYYFSLDFHLLDQANEKLNLREDFFACRLKVREKFSTTYNIVGSLDKYNHRYNRYCVNCLF